MRTSVCLSCAGPISGRVLQGQEDAAGDGVHDRRRLIQRAKNASQGGHGPALLVSKVSPHKVLLDMLPC